MAITEAVAVITTALWPQGDIRDPLGVWGFRRAVTGDASGGSIKVTAQAAGDQAAAYIFACYSALLAVVTQATTASPTGKIRLLTNWPNVDPQAGVQAYGSGLSFGMLGVTALTAPEVVPNVPLIGPADRFILLFDPRPSAGALDLIEMEFGGNILADVYSFEGYGYYWDRSVLNAPGGPRHPGAS